MKILYGITKSNFGGAQRYVFDLATEAKKTGHDVTVLCGGAGALVDKLKESGVRVIEIKEMKRDISLVDEFRSFHFIFRKLVEEKPDVFHTNSSKMGGLGNLAARLAGVKRIVFTSHGWAFNEPRPFWQKFIIKCFAWLTVLLSHKTIAVSNVTRKQIKNWPFIKEKLEVIHNGIEKFPTLPRTEARRALGVSEDAAVLVGTLSELHPVKGLDILLDAWKRFLEKHDARLVIVGDGEARESLRDYAEHLGIAHTVTFAGYKENARQYLSGLDLFCLPSRSEALPYTVLEAGIACLPVLATSVGGVPEIIENGVTGALVPPNDSEALFSTLILLCEDKMLRHRLGTALKETVEKDFSLSKMKNDTMRIYDSGIRE
jgi:glycosyltransferase involved in cell wall biosynthesis